jgi:hypothetical protein
MLGHIEWMEAFYECLDCFVMPSHWEPHWPRAPRGAGLWRAHHRLARARAGIHRARRRGLAALSGRRRRGAGGLRQRLAREPRLVSTLAAGGRANSARYTMDAFASTLDTIYANLGKEA